MSLNKRIAPRRDPNEAGIALITSMLIMLLMSALLVGFTAVIVSDQRFRFIDRDRGTAFYSAAAGIEKLTADLGNLFFTNVAPTGAQVTALTTKMPSITGVSYTASSAPTGLPASLLSNYHCKSPKSAKTVGTNGYTIMYCASTTGDPTTDDDPLTIKSGPYAGLIALQTPYQLDVTAKTTTGGETHLIRTVDAVAIPVFQFGIFSDPDLSFFAGPNFDFGGRVHTNGNLFLAEGDGATLTLRDKVTAVKEVVRQRLQNGVSIDTSPAHNGTVNMATSQTAFRALARTEGSVVDTVGSSFNAPTWHNISLSTYNSWIRNGRTGANALNLPLITVGGTNPDLIRRPPTGEDTANAILFNERLFTKASVRILLSDTAADITSLPTVTSAAPVQLDGDWLATPPTNGLAPAYTVDATHPPIARSMGTLSATTTAATTTTSTSISVNAVPALYQPSPLWLNNAVSVTCTGRTPTTFTGCTVPQKLFSGWSMQVRASDNRLGNFAAATPALTVNGNVTCGTYPCGGKTITVSGGNPESWQIGATTLWLNGTSGWQMVTCLGNNAAATQFTECTNVPQSSTGAALTNGYLSAANTGTIGGYLKVEVQNAAGAWTDVTMQLLSYGIGAANLTGGGTACADPTPNAILRLQRLRDNGNAATCGYAGSTSSYDWWPNVLFDTREGLVRDTDPGNTNLTVGGTMHYISIDVANLAKWFKGTAPYNTGSGTTGRIDNTGFTVYFSDRRNNRNAANLETSEYGWEDFVNPLSAAGTANGTLDAGEDVNASGTLETYGSLPNYKGVAGAVPPGAAAPLDATARPSTTLTRAQAQVNRVLLFRHALKLVNGSNIAGLGVNGLTIVSENPVYVQGDWNASGGAFNDPHAATAIIADAVTLLSNSWTDTVSFTDPYAPGNRNRNTASWYRVAIIAGKGMAFANPANTAADFGTDGGTHNFLRYLEDGDQPVNYKGSMATFFFNRQAVGTYKCCNTVYTAPTRNYSFDTDFLDPSKLPPNTPVFRDLNAVGFSQELRPGK